MQAQPHHQIIPFGDRMLLTDYGTNRIIVEARRSGADEWTLSSSGAQNVTVETGGTRRAAVDAMIDMALAVLPEDGYATWVPGYHDEHGNFHCLRDEP